MKIPPGEAVAVLGDGKLGLLVAQVLQAHGARVHQFGRHKEKLRISAQAGVTTEIVREGRLPRAAYRFTVDATGSSAGLCQAVGLTQPRGTVILKSTIHDVVPVDTAPVIVNEITLVGSRCGRFEPALRLLSRGRVNVEDMIAARCSLANAPGAFALAAQQGVLKVLLDG